MHSLVYIVDSIKFLTYKACLLCMILFNTSESCVHKGCPPMNSSVKGREGNPRQTTWHHGKWMYNGRVRGSLWFTMSARSMRLER